MVILDACVLIAYAYPGHVHHERALELLAEPEQFVINELTLAEYLVKPASLGLDVTTVQAQILADLRARVASPAELSKEVPWSARIAQTRAKTGLRMPDAVVLATALATTGKLATFDARLATIAQNLGILAQSAQ